MKLSELRRLKEETNEIFSNIGTEKSRQRLVYDLLNTLKTKDRNRFMWLILKNINTVITDEKIGIRVKKYSDFLAEHLMSYEMEENFEKIAYAIIMGIMSVEKKKESEGGEEVVKNE
ncbi:MAG: hypothetical protein RMJ17_00725 [Candidatus Aenigmarchaeota archaeon]|nr:hypothetical protein [Candidatus Aenigmarchaeota archaeon]MDW8149112.1 hypothetical protein [Candidatus Aenigmarchaeota archaeon]